MSKTRSAFWTNAPKDQPFCLTLAFFATHAEDPNPEQYLYQPESESLYEGVTIPVPATATESHFQRLPPFLATEKNEGRIRWHWRFDSPEKYQKYMKAYYRMVTEVDSAIGRILEALEAQGRSKIRSSCSWGITATFTANTAWPTSGTPTRSRCGSP